MPKYALLVEDEVEQSYFTKSILENNDFTTFIATSYTEALDQISEIPRPLDVVVLDRRIPREAEDEPSDVVGDDLLDKLLTLVPDSVFIVFTGHTGIPHHQFATRQRGIIEVTPKTQALDRVCNFEKWQTNEFEDYLEKIRIEIDSLSDVELVGQHPDALTSEISRRLLRKVARYFGGVCIDVAPLSGGLAGLPVWRCQVRDESGHQLASVVVKQTDGSKIPPGAGLHTILPAGYVAAPTAYVSGLCDGYQAQIMQMAGSEPQSLLELLDTDEAQASTQLGLIADAIGRVPSPAVVSKTLAELARPLVDWTDLSSRLHPLDVTLPRGGMMASTHMVAQHGDLHPGNILVVDGNPVLIDFDNEVIASRALDALTALLSPLFHPDSTIRSSTWPSVEQCEQLGTQDFLVNCPYPSWMTRAYEWFVTSSTGDRERQALVFAYAARQLKYPDVLGDSLLKARAIALAKAAAAKLTM